MLKLRTNFLAAVITVTCFTLLNQCTDGAGNNPLNGALAAATGQNAGHLRSTGYLSTTVLPVDASQMPLSTSGRYIIDNNGNRFKLKSVNWAAHGVEAAKIIDLPFDVVEGLDRQPIEHIIGLIKEWGFNSIRLTFSNEMLHRTIPVGDEHLTANPSWSGLTPLEVLDKTIEALTDAGIVVILNNHTTTSQSCCGYDGNGLWHMDYGRHPQSEDQWIADWLMLADRYKSNKMVAGADLRNEVRTTKLGGSLIPKEPTWGGGGSDDWHRASQRAGREVLKVNPDLLIIVEGINWAGLLPNFGGGHRPVMEPANRYSVSLQDSNKLVYAAHNYAFTGPYNNGDRTGGTAAGRKNYAELTDEEFRTFMDKEWSFVLENDNHFTAPIWISEFGGHYYEERPLQQAWLTRFVDYLIEKDVSFAWWQLRYGPMGLVTEDYSQRKTDDYRLNDVTRLLAHDGLTGPVPGSDKYTQLHPGRGDYNLSQYLQNIDWNVGTRKANCPDGQRLVGTAEDRRSLCTDSFYGDLWDATKDYTVKGPATTGGTIWAPSRVQYECDQGEYISGFSTSDNSGINVNGIVCAKANTNLGNVCQTVWFNQRTRRFSEKGADFAHSNFKGQCGDDQYLKGMAHSGGRVQALRCCGTEARPMMLKSHSSETCMGVQDGIMQNGTRLRTTSCQGTDDHMWVHDEVTGQFRSAKDPNYCIDNSGQHKNGGLIHIWQCVNGGHPNQAFDRDGWVIRHRANNKYTIDKYGSGRIGTWYQSGGSRQKWTEIY